MAAILSQPQCVNIEFSQWEGPFYWHGLTLIPAWISNYIHYKMWDEINFNSTFVEVQE